MSDRQVIQHDIEIVFPPLIDVKSIVLCGIEGHACVQQTVFDLIEKKYDVHVITDAVSSRNMVDRLVNHNHIIQE